MEVNCESIPVSPTLDKIWRGLPDETLANEQARLQRVLAETLGKLSAIETIRRDNGQHTLFTEDS